MARVLIVEDDSDVRDWIAHCLLREGHELRGVPDGARARGLPAAEPDYRPDVPAVFVTVQWTGQVIDRIERTGHERVAKPFDADDLRAAVRRAQQRTSVTDGLPPGLPALLYADKVLDRLERSGRPAAPPGDGLGDRLLALVAEAGADGEQALGDAVRRLLWASGSGQESASSGQESASSGQESASPAPQ